MRLQMTLLFEGCVTVIVGIQKLKLMSTMGTAQPQHMELDPEYPTA